MKASKEQAKAYPLRLPREVRERAEKEAREGCRTLHGELLYRLRRAYQLAEAA